MENNAVISIRTNQELDGEQETIALDTVGKYAIRNNKIYIIYDESDMTGFEDTTTTIKVSDGNVSVRRSGRYTSKMNYLTGEKSLCLINTPYGQVGDAITTENINFDFGDNGGTLNMNYLLDADNQNFIKNNMTVTVRTDSVTESKSEIN